MTLSPINIKKTCLVTEVYYDYSNENIEIQNQIEKTMSKVWNDSINRLSKLLIKNKPSSIN